MEKLLTLNQAVQEARNIGFKIDIQTLQQLVKADLIDAEKATETEYLVPFSEIERLAFQHMNAGLRIG